VPALHVIGHRHFKDTTLALQVFLTDHRAGFKALHGERVKHKLRAFQCSQR